MPDVRHKRVRVAARFPKRNRRHERSSAVTGIDYFVFEPRSVPTSMSDGHVASQLAQGHQSYLDLVWHF